MGVWCLWARHIKSIFYKSKKMICKEKILHPRPLCTQTNGVVIVSFSHWGIITKLWITKCTHSKYREAVEHNKILGAVAWKTEKVLWTIFCTGKVQAPKQTMCISSGCCTTLSPTIINCWPHNLQSFECCIMLSTI